MCFLMGAGGGFVYGGDCAGMMAFELCTDGRVNDGGTRNVDSKQVSLD